MSPPEGGGGAGNINISCDPSLEPSRRGPEDMPFFENKKKYL